ncbi:MAG TPA: tRNA pseudouridine(38-40) synthase TruA [Hydrogenophaga sp.]|uniref:tRNA pseudouridine(38-40) synthase TruA n=1 Tax=Hydrogenophaga sp. TaxID=1904254 RepID=UPI002C80CF7A|nr:tRNA pseudouridine(38-40) synthase TruA [Hydrogenophaga sp.]HMN94566.1 tRNA pseudouridine(38-40) synthase TruA [Hydrogenophaga sp.]HMP10056.1 tRNA pseudouridine(38-40) synthase TruA [Hydrogenophaga sp.]
MRIALGISYHGGAYDGWQSQPGGRTVQDHLEGALARFLAVPAVSTLCAGRTDAGVHGLNQVVHFDTPLSRPQNAWVRGTNSFLPPDIAVQWAREVSESFHARASARSRRYAYLLLESPVRPSVDSGQVGWVFRPLSMEPMREAAQALIGEHDFSSFRAAQCQAHTPVKHMLRIEIARRGAYWRFEFEATAFLHHMIRNIMGCLIAIGTGNRSPGWMAEVLAARSRDAAAPTFSPDGLYFLGPVYDPVFNLPERTPAFDWLP